MKSKIIISHAKMLPRTVQELKASTVIEGYTIEGLIGTGAFSDVYRVKNSGDGTFALKVTRGANIPYSLQEATILDHLSEQGSRYALPFIEHFSFQDERGEKLHCIVVEYLDGLTLDAVIRRPGGAGRLALPLLAEMARGLDEIHALGVAHRDIKPENIFVDMKFGRCRLLFIDFGLSCVDFKDIQSFCNHPVGSRLWMAPEIWRHGEILGQIEDSMRADIWALGVVFHQTLHRGAFPYEIAGWGSLPNDPYRIAQTKSAGDPRLFYQAPPAAKARRFAPRPPIELPPLYAANIPAAKERVKNFAFADRRSGAGLGYFDRLGERAPGVPGGPPLAQSASYIENRADHYALPFDSRVEIQSSRYFPATNPIVAAMLTSDPLDRPSSLDVAHFFSEVPGLEPRHCQALRALPNGVSAAPESSPLDPARTGLGKRSYPGERI